MVAVLASSGCKLQEFLLRSCELPIKLAKAIIGSLEHNATLYKLDLADNGTWAWAWARARACVCG